MKAEYIFDIRCEAYRAGAHIELRAQSSIDFLPPKNLSLTVDDMDTTVVSVHYNANEAMLLIELAGCDFETAEDAIYQATQCWVGANETNDLHWYIADIHHIEIP
jgi:hypothetical protein